MHAIITRRQHTLSYTLLITRLQHTLLVLSPGTLTGCFLCTRCGSPYLRHIPPQPPLKVIDHPTPNRYSLATNFQGTAFNIPFDAPYLKTPFQHPISTKSLPPSYPSSSSFPPLLLPPHPSSLIIPRSLFTPFYYNPGLSCFS